MVWRRYLGLPGLTAERFVSDPEGFFPDISIERAMCALAHGWEFGVYSRADAQVKIRGYRISLAGERS
jgi:non-ribosomal peptide synthetase component F